MSETYNCENCQTRDFIEGWEAMKKHLVEVHGVDLARQREIRHIWTAGIVCQLVLRASGVLPAR